MTSTNESSVSNVYLVDYFIYCPLLSEKEGQEDRKILYYHPADADIDHQIRTIGYCEGLVKFSETFDFDDPCECVHFQKSRLLLDQVENDIYFAMILHVPITERKKDEEIILEYNDENINDKMMLPMLKMSYRYFALQYGTVTALIQNRGVEESRNILRKYFDKFIQNHFHNLIPDITIDSSYFGVQFVPVEKRLYLKIQTLLRRFELCFTSLKQTILLYRNQLIWSGFNQDDTSLIYSFVRQYYWPSIKTLSNISNIRYLVVDTSEDSTDEIIVSMDLISQEIFLGNPSVSHRMLTINFNFITLLCIFENDEELSNNEETLSKIELLKADLDRTLSNPEELFRRKPLATDPTIRNIYFNKMNMAHSSTVDWNREPANVLAGVINTLAEDLQWFHPAGEMMVKGENDPWIIAKRSDMRQLLVLVNQKTANLKDIRDKLKQMFSTQFNNMLLIE